MPTQRFRADSRRKKRANNTTQQPRPCQNATLARPNSRFAQPEQPLYTTQNGTLAPQKRHFTVRHAPRQHAQTQSHGHNTHAANPLRLHTQKGQKNGQDIILRAELPRMAAAMMQISCKGTPQYHTARLSFVSYLRQCYIFCKKTIIFASV